MDFEWDESKREINVAKHGVDFVDAARVLTRPYLAYPSPRKGEDRWVAVGKLHPPDIRPEKWSGPLVAIVYAMRGDRYRIISARRATTNERRQYEDRFG
jgi:hypothetical protein